MKFGDHDHVLLSKIEPRSLMAAVKGWFLSTFVTSYTNFVPYLQAFIILIISCLYSSAEGIMDSIIDCYVNDRKIIVNNIIDISQLNYNTNKVCIF